MKHCDGNVIAKYASYGIGYRYYVAFRRRTARIGVGLKSPGGAHGATWKAGKSSHQEKRRMKLKVSGAEGTGEGITRNVVDEPSTEKRGKMFIVYHVERENSGSWQT
jgi:hypothetical protein